MARLARLATDVSNAGLGFTYMDGRWTYETGETGEERVLFIVGDEHDHGRLKGLLKKWVRDYDQEAAVIKPEGDTDAYLLDASGSETSVGQFHPNRIGGIYTSLRNHPGTFKFEEGFVEMGFAERLAEEARRKSRSGT